MAFYLVNGNVAYWPDGQTPPWSDPYVPTSDPNMAGAKTAPTDSWYALPGNGGKVYIKAGNPIPNAGTGSTMQWATPYQATDDQGTMPADQSGGVIHQPGATDAASWKLPGRGQFENQAWTGPSDWRGVPFAQSDTQGRPLSQYNNLVDQYQASRQPINVGQQFGRWNFGGGMLNQPGQQGTAAGAQNGLFGQASQPRVAVDQSFAGVAPAPTQTPANANPTWTPPAWANTTPQTPTTTPAAPAPASPTPDPTPKGTFGPSPTPGAGGYSGGSLWESLRAGNPAAFDSAYGPASNYYWIDGLPYKPNPSANGQLTSVQYWGSGAQPEWQTGQNIAPTTGPYAGTNNWSMYGQDPGWAPTGGWK